MAVITLKRTKTEQLLNLYSHRLSDMVRNLMFEFLSNLRQHAISMDNADMAIEVKTIVENGNELASTVRVDSTKNTTILLTVEEKDVILNFRSYWYNDQYLYHELTITSTEEFTFTDYAFIDYLLENSVYHSEFKGAYINIESDDAQNFYKHELPERTFDDIYLPEKMIKDLKGYIALYEKRERMLRYLFVGLPGSGKTESLIVLANMLKQQGVTILKVSAAALRNGVKFANILAPALIVLDDIDLDLGNRDDYSHTTYLRAFLDILDGVEKLSPNVGVIATTNALWLVDTAAQRPGRFNKILAFGTLTKENIKHIIEKALNHIGMEEYEKVLASPELVDTYSDKKQTGAYIYNMTQMLANQIDIGMLEAKPKEILDYMVEDADLLASLQAEAASEE
ncbi:MAG: ATP-binding protein [Bacteroidetes bacterium]|nr:MAG: ATP-binding protein [Bacteroidota bacterium]